MNFDALIGVPFAYGGRGPDTYDCYGLLRELYKRDGIDIPDYTSPTDAGRITALMGCQLHLWELAECCVGAAVLMRVLDRSGNTNMHVGYVIDENRMIHTWESSGGVVIEPLEVWKRRIKGFYRYVG